MFESNIFDEYLEDEAKRVLTQDDKLIMILKSQTNYFYHQFFEIKND